MRSGEQSPTGSPTSGKWTSFQIGIAILLVSTGSVNTLAAKWADQMYALGVKFEHPFMQAVCMFLGEFLCLPVFFIVYKLQQRRAANEQMTRDLGQVQTNEPVLPKFNPLVMLPAAVCDMMATSIMYVGLNLTNASSFQMLRGSVVIFTGLLSMFVLRARLESFRWIGMISVFLGLIVVGLADILFANTTAGDNAILGDALIICAQVIVACQMVYEQKFVMKYDIPALLAVGLEGLFGMTILSALIVPMHFIRVPANFTENPGDRMEDIPFAFRQLVDNPLIIVALTGTVLSIAFFNFAGISVTKELSATTRMVLDSIRTIIIWMFSLAFHWQQFVYLQIFGFALLILGMFIYNDILIGPWLRKKMAIFRNRSSEADSLVANDQLARSQNREPYDAIDT